MTKLVFKFLLYTSLALLVVNTFRFVRSKEDRDLNQMLHYLSNVNDDVIDLDYIQSMKYDLSAQPSLISLYGAKVINAFISIVNFFSLLINLIVKGFNFIRYLIAFVLV